MDGGRSAFLGTDDGKDIDRAGGTKQYLIVNRDIEVGGREFNAFTR
jgi:hypothetical protein